MNNLKIEFGSGGRKLDGWTCHDMDCDIRSPLPYASNSAVAIFASHVCEHVSTHECFAFFQEVHRVLAPLGTFLISVPVLTNIATREHAIDLIRGHGHQIVFSRQSLEDMLWAAGFERNKIKTRNRHATLDIHHTVIGIEKDNMESCRVVAEK